MTDDDNLFGDVIFSYSRAQAIADGVLIDVSVVSRAAGFTVPVAVTAAAWASCIAVPDGARNQNELLRQWSLFWHVHHAISRAQARTSRVTFPLETRDSHGRDERAELVAVLGPGDDGEAVMTIMFTDED